MWSYDAGGLAFSRKGDRSGGVSRRNGTEFPVALEDMLDTSDCHLELQAAFKCRVLLGRSASNILSIMNHDLDLTAELSFHDAVPFAFLRSCTREINSMSQSEAYKYFLRSNAPSIIPAYFGMRRPVA